MSSTPEKPDYHDPEYMARTTTMAQVREWGEAVAPCLYSTRTITTGNSTSRVALFSLYEREAFELIAKRIEGLPASEAKPPLNGQQLVRLRHMYSKLVQHTRELLTERGAG